MAGATTDTALTGDRSEAVGMESDEIAHLAGFFDGVGVLTVNVIESDRHRIGYTLRPSCSITRAKHRDDPAMGKVAAYCDEYNIGYGVEDVDHGEARTGESNRIQLRKPRDIELFLEPLLPYLVTNYEQAILMLETVIPAIENDAHLEKESFHELMETVDTIRKLNNSSRESEYNQNYFEELWSLTTE